MYEGDTQNSMMKSERKAAREGEKKHTRNLQRRQQVMKRNRSPHIFHGAFYELKTI